MLFVADGRLFFVVDSLLDVLPIAIRSFFDGLANRRPERFQHTFIELGDSDRFRLLDDLGCWEMMSPPDRKRHTAKIHGK